MEEVGASFEPDRDTSEGAENEMGDAQRRGQCYQNRSVEWSWFLLLRP
jgi:hypothetical protein